MSLVRIECYESSHVSVFLRAAGDALICNQVIAAYEGKVQTIDTNRETPRPCRVKLDTFNRGENIDTLQRVSGTAARLVDCRQSACQRGFCDHKDHRNRSSRLCSHIPILPEAVTLQGETLPRYLQVVQKIFGQWRTGANQQAH